MIRGVYADTYISPSTASIYVKANACLNQNKSSSNAEYQVQNRVFALTLHLLHQRLHSCSTHVYASAVGLNDGISLSLSFSNRVERKKTLTTHRAAGCSRSHRVYGHHHAWTTQSPSFIIIIISSPSPFPSPSSSS